MVTAEPISAGLEQLKVSSDIRRDLETFVHQLTALYEKDLISITVFGSAAAGQYSQQTSDVNLLVVYSELNVVDLKAVAKLAREWAKKRNFSPRFLSKRNLLNSIRYFQVDWVDMKDAHIVLYGEDVLAGIEVHPADMHWQVAHEIKRMRMRIKQQFWRACGDEVLLRRIIIERFSSLLHLMQALLFLRYKAKTTAEPNVVEMAVREFGIDANWAQKLQELKNGSLKLNRDELMDAFAGLMDIIRLIDTAADRTVV